MQLVSALAAGVKGAESGTAKLYKRGTSTRADWYEDFEGTSQISSGADIALNANGAYQVYVNEYVDVLVYDAQGNLVIQFAEGSAANAIETNGQSFTGAAYSGGASGASKPVNLQAVLNLWKTNNAATDWKVDLGSGAVTIPAAIGPITEAWFNVKDPVYAAVGDGSNDDSANVQAAIDACTAAGGGIVFFPPGTYRVTVQIDVETGVSLMGCGMEATILRMDHGTNILAAFAANAGRATCDGMTFDNAQASTGTELIDIAASCEVVFRGCKFGSASYSNQTAIIDQNGEAVFEDCEFAPGASAASTIDVDGDTKLSRCILPQGASTATVVDVTGLSQPAQCVISDSSIIPAATCNATLALVYGKNFHVRNSVFKCATSTAGTYKCCYPASVSGSACSVIGCLFEDNGGATVTCIYTGSGVSDAPFHESGNAFGSFSSTNVAYGYLSNSIPNRGDMSYGTRETRVLATTGDDASVALDADQYGFIYYSKTGTTDVTFTMDVAPPGCRCVVRIKASGGAVTNVTMNTVGASATAAMTNGRSNYYLMESMGDSWVVISERLDIAD